MKRSKRDSAVQRVILAATMREGGHPSQSRAKAKLREKVLQLSNDLSESMPMGRWSRKDLMDAITYWNDSACESAQILAAYRSKIIIKISELLRAAQ